METGMPRQQAVTGNFQPAAEQDMQTELRQVDQAVVAVVLIKRLIRVLVNMRNQAGVGSMRVHIIQIHQQEAMEKRRIMHHLDNLVGVLS